MKQKFTSKKMIFLILIVLFIAGQVMGTIAIKTIFLNYKIQELSPRLTYITEEIARGTFVLSRNNDFILKAYDVYGVEMKLFDDEAHETAGIKETLVDQSLKQLIQKAIAGNEIAILDNIEGQSSESIIIGMPISKDNSIIGVAFLVKPASDFEAVLRGFYIVFSITLLMGTGLFGLFLTLYLKESKQMEQMRRDYVANISHELNSPIASIKALTETLADKVIQDEDTRDKYYSIILKESSQLQKLITDMLELSRLQSGKMAFRKALIHTPEMMQDLTDKYSILANELDVSFEITQNAMAAPNLYSNRDRILQVFNILLNNAFKFVGNPGSVVVDAEITRKQVKFMIIDNGAGIDKNILPYIFDRFYKEDTSHNVHGSGLGLSIAKEILTGLNETIAVSSQVGEGTTFELTIHRE